jgi:hypothetical protein
MNRTDNFVNSSKRDIRSENITPQNIFDLKNIDGNPTNILKKRIFSISGGEHSNLGATAMQQLQENLVYNLDENVGTRDEDKETNK